MKLLGSNKSKITKDKYENGENEPNLEITDIVVLVHDNIVSNNYQQHSRILHSSIPNKSFWSTTKYFS